MKMPSAFEILPPHQAYDATRKLESAYRQRVNVNPIVVIRADDGRLVALTGSHRIAAMRNVFGKKSIPSKYVLFLPESDLRTEFRKTSNPRGANKRLDDYLAHQASPGSPISHEDLMLLSEYAGDVNDRVYAAIEDQVQ